MSEILAAAQARASAREAIEDSRPRIDYKEANKVFPKQKAALTRAIRSGDPDKVVAACKKAVDQWRVAPFHGAWPDDWARWQRALDDALGWRSNVRLEDL